MTIATTTAREGAIGAPYRPPVTGYTDPGGSTPNVDVPMDRVRRLIVALVVLVVAGLVVLVVTVRPGLRDNADEVDRSWKPEWIGEYSAPTAGPLTTVREPDPDPS